METPECFEKTNIRAVSVFLNIKLVIMVTFGGGKEWESYLLYPLPAWARLTEYSEHIYISYI